MMSDNNIALLNERYLKLHVISLVIGGVCEKCLSNLQLLGSMFNKINFI